MLGHLRATGALNTAVFNGAEQKIGADLADALSGDLAKSILAAVDAEIRRLEQHDFKIGETVSWRFGGEKAESKIIAVHDETVRLDFNGTNPGYAIEKRKLTGAALPTLKHMREACNALLGGALSPEAVAMFGAIWGSKPEQYPVQDLDD